MRMRGKRSNKEFISNFIENSVKEGKISLNEIYSDVTNQISSIEEKIKEVEILKSKRKDLLDVKEFLGKTLNG